MPQTTVSKKIAVFLCRGEALALFDCLICINLVKEENSLQLLAQRDYPPYSYPHLCKLVSSALIF